VVRINLKANKAVKGDAKAFLRGIARPIQGLPIRSQVAGILAVLSAVIALPTAGAQAASPALPTGGQYVAGAGTIAAAGANGLQITQQGARGIIDWRSFNIGQGGAVSINNGSGATLNRVTGGQMSTIEGTLSSTGSLYLVNPQGVVIGPNGQVLSGGSVAISSRDIANDAFMAGGSMTAAGTSAGDVTNKGAVLARQGDVVIIGQNVNNAGAISAANGTATLAAGNTVVLAPVGGSSGVVVAADSSATGDVTNSGKIQAAAAALMAAGGNVYSLAGNTGLIQATGAANIDGHVYLTAPNGMASVSGAIVAKNADGSGGTIIVNGKQVSIGATARLDATGLYGGRVFIGVSAPQTDLADSTTIVDGATILAGGPNGGGYIETSGHTVQIGMATISAGAGGSWLVDPGDLTIDSAAATTIEATLNSGTSVTQSATTSGGQLGDLTVSAPITWTSAATLTLNADNNMTIAGGITAANGTLVLNSALNRTLGQAVMNIYNPISVGTLTINAGSTLNIATSAGTIAASGALTTVSTSGTNIASNVAISGNLVNMDAQYYQFNIGSGSSISGTTGVIIGTGGTDGAFINNAGPSAITVGAGARYLIYSVNPSQDTTGGLTNNFIQYSANFGDAALGTGNGFLYSLAPVLNYALNKGSTTKVYDGTNAVNQTTPLTAAANMTVTGLQSGDVLSILNPLNSTYTTTNVGTSLTVTIPGVSITHTGGIPVYGYAIGQQNLSGVIGSITAAPLSIASGVTANNKVYDGTTTGTLSVGTLVLNGVVAADANNSAKLAVNTAGVTGTFASANVANGVGVTAAGFVLTGSSQNNYVLTQPTGLSANITKAPLTAVGIGASDKVYDGTTNATLNYTNASLSGLASVDVGNVTLDHSGATAAFTTANVGNGLQINISGLGITGTGSSNYQMTSTATAHATITQASLTITGTTVANKTYNGSTTGTLSNPGTLVGVVAADVAGGIAALSLNSSGVTPVFTTANAGNGVAVTVTGFTLNGTSANNYSLTQPTGITANITPVTLGINLAGTYTKTYDATNAATIANLANITLSNVVPGDTISVSQVASAIYNSINAATGLNVTANLTTSDFTAGGGTVLSNYVLPTTVSTTNAASSITPAPLVVTIVGNPSRTFTTVGDTSAPALTTANYLIAGFAGSESATINQTTATYDSGNAGARTVTASLASGNFTASNGFLLSNYSLGGTTLSSLTAGTVTGFGAINPSGGLSTSFSLQVKTYDGVATFSIAPGSFTVSGFNPGDGATIVNLDGTTNASLTGTIATANVGTQPGSVTLNTNLSGNAGVTGFGNYKATGATNLANYILPTSGFGSIQINAKPLTAAINATSVVKTYDGSTSVTLNPGIITLSGFAAPNGNAEGATVTQTVGTFASANAGNSVSFSAVISGPGPNGSPVVSPNAGTLLSNYILPTTVTGIGVINKANLTVSGVYGISKVYDSTNAATLNTTNAAFSGLVGSDSLTLTSPTTGTFNSVNVGSGIGITATGFSLSGNATTLGNYNLIQPTGLNANITPASVFANVVANNKVYDGNTSVTFGSTVLGLVYAADNGNVVLNIANAAFSQSDAANGIAISATYTLTGTAAGNYKLTTPPTNVKANITPAPLSGSIIGNPTKIYDGTTGLTLTSANFSITGWVNNEGADVTVQPTAANDFYSSANAGSTSTYANATLGFSNFVATGSTKLSNYYLPGGTSQVTGHVSGLGAITQAPLIAQIIGNPTRVYDANTDIPGAANLTLTSANFALLGFKGSDGATVANTTGTTGSFNTQHAGTDVITLTGLQTSNFTATGGTLLSNYALPTTASGGGTIMPFALTLTGVTAQDKVYENSPFASLNTNTAVLNGIFAQDNGLNIGFNAGSGAFNDKNVGASKPVTATGFTLTNNTNNDYILTQPTVPNAAITPRALTLDASKVYDGTTNASGAVSGITYSNLLGIYNGDQVQLGSTAGVVGTFSSKNVDANGSNTVNYSTGAVLTGADAGNYVVQSGNGTITAKALTITGAYGVNRQYSQGNTTVSINNTSAALSGIVAGETETLAIGNAPATGTIPSDQVGNNYAVTPVSAYTFTGDTHGNYTLTQPSLTASISQAGVTLINIASVTKVYDGTNLLPTTFDLNNFFTLSGLTGNDANTVTIASAPGTFASSNVGTGINVTLTGAVQLTGTNFANYTVVNPLPANNTLGTITPRPLTVTLGPVTKTYDGGATADVTGKFSLSGFATNENATVNLTSGSYTNANVLGPAGSTVTASLLSGSFTSTGTQAFLGSNYSIGGVQLSTVNPITVTNTASTITPLTLTATFAPISKVYDGTGSATGLAIVASGFLGTANTSSVGGVTTGTYTPIGGGYNAGNANYTVTSGSLGSATFALASGATGTLADYALPTTASATGNSITVRPLTVTLGPVTKTYDGGASANVTGLFTLGGFANNENASVNQTVGTYTNANVLGAGLSTVKSGLASGNFTSTGTQAFVASNYSIGGTAISASPITVTNTASTINPLTLGATFNPITKVYDGGGSAAGLLGALSATGFIGTSNTATLSNVPASANANAAYVAIGGLYNVGSNYTVNSGTITGATFALPAGASGILADYALPTFATQTGNAITPAVLGLTPINIAAVQKVYDGTSALPSTIDLANFFTLSGVIGNDQVSVASASGCYCTGLAGTQFTNVGSGLPITITNGSVVLAGAQRANYTVANLTAGSLIGIITPRPLSVVLGPKTKVYDSTTGIALAASDFTLSGFASGQGATLNQTVGTYASKDVLGQGGSTISASLSSANYVGSGGFLASNYSLPTSVTNTASTITPAPLTATGVLANNKVYDATTAATLTTTGATLTGLFSGDTVTLSNTNGSATFADPNAGNGKTVTAALSSFSIGGAQAGDYTLTAINTLSANITPAPLTAAIIGNPTKVYDGTTGATLTPANFALTGFVGPDGSTITQTVGTYASPNAGSPNVTATLTGGNFSPTGGTLLSNYILPTSATGPGTITPAQLTAVIIGTPTKPFDGNTGATLTPANFALTGFIGPDGVTVSQTVGTYAAPTPGSEGVTAVLNSSVVAPTGSTLLSNYTLPANAAGLGLINAAPQAAVTGDVFTTIINATSLLPPAVANAIAAAVSSPDFIRKAREAAFTVADVRTYIPYPAPGALSTWRNNGWGTLPIVIDETTDYTQIQDDNGNLAVQSGAPLINSTEQVLLSGVKNKRWRITIPQFGSGPGLTASGAIVAGQ
jgi:filamentous hemagglutinin family protein